MLHGMPSTQRPVVSSQRSPLFSPQSRSRLHFGTQVPSSQRSHSWQSSSTSQGRAPPVPPVPPVPPSPPPVPPSPLPPVPPVLSEGGLGSGSSPQPPPAAAASAATTTATIGMVRSQREGVISVLPRARGASRRGPWNPRQHATARTREQLPARACGLADSDSRCPGYRSGSTLSRPARRSGADARLLFRAATPQTRAPEARRPASPPPGAVGVRGA